MTGFHSVRGVGMSKNNPPPRHLLKTFNNRPTKPTRVDAPLGDPQPSEVYGPSNDTLPDILYDEEFPDLCPSPASKNEEVSTKASSKRSVGSIELEESEPADFYDSFRFKSEPLYSQSVEGSKSTESVNESSVTMNEKSPKQEEACREGEAAFDIDDDTALPLDNLDDSDCVIPSLLVGTTTKRSVIKGGRGRKGKPAYGKTKPLADSDSSDDGPVSNRGNIKPSFPRARKLKPPSEDIESSQGSQPEKKKPHRKGSGLDASHKPKVTTSSEIKGPPTLKRKSTESKDTNENVLPDPDSQKDIFDPIFQNSSIFQSSSRPVSHTFGKQREKQRQKENESTAKRVKKEKKPDTRIGSESPKHTFPSWIPNKIEGDSSPLRAPDSKAAGEIPYLHSSSPVKKPTSFKVPDRIEDTDQSSPEKVKRPSFKLPAELSDPEDPSWLNSPTTKDALAGSDILLRRSSSPLTDLDSPSLPSDSGAICPLCKKEVDKNCLDDFKKKHPVWTVRLMQKFCQMHKKRNAKTFWEEKGYPKIKWRQLDERISQHLPLLRSILEGKRGSHYNDLFKEKTRSGQNRTLLKSDQLILTPGYYGHRGMRQMSENLIHEFSGILRRRTLEDSLIGARGYSTYLQAVLVPELAVRLIMDDLGIDEEKARGVLGESIWVGELLHDEIADVVFESSDEEMEGDP